MSAGVDLAVGRTYRGKRPAPVGGMFQPLVNDRTIVYLGVYELQYDGPSVKPGRHYPRVPIETFRSWMARDVTDELPEKEYAPWPPTTTTAQQATKEQP